ncbi:hypothetical protein HOD88_00375 [archaeon]|jgi:hypothetical protein|nr:hypothetical protein [archaeon]
MKRGFGDLFNDSVGELKNNFKLTSKVVFLLYFIPLILVSIFQIILYINTGYFSYDLLDFEMEFPFSFLFDLFLGIFYVLMASSLVYFSLQKKKINFNETLEGGKKYFWAFVGLFILIGLFVSLWSLLFIIPGIIFAIYWILSEYLLIDKKSTIWESMRSSKKLIKGNWWRTFGFVILIAIFTLIISFVFSIPEGIFGSFLKLRMAMGIIPSTIQLVWLEIFALISSLAYFVVVPFTIFFYKNLYLNLKKK